MARWTPNDSAPIVSSEHIGRRLFDEPKLSGAPDQKPFSGLLISHFIEDRGSDFSVDRLGKASLDKKVIQYLLRRCENAAKTFRREKKFNGWAYCTANKLLKDTSWAIHPSGIRARDENGVELPWSDGQMTENRYHAHVQMPTGIEAIRFAYDVREKMIDVHPVLHRDEIARPKSLIDRTLKMAQSAFRAISSMFAVRRNKR